MPLCHLAEHKLSLVEYQSQRQRRDRWWASSTCRQFRWCHATALPNLSSCAHGRPHQTQAVCMCIEIDVVGNFSVYIYGYTGGPKLTLRYFCCGTSPGSIGSIMSELFSDCWLLSSLFLSPRFSSCWTFPRYGWYPGAVGEATWWTPCWYKGGLVSILCWYLMLVGCSPSSSIHHMIWWAMKLYKCITCTCSHHKQWMFLLSSHYFHN